MSTEPEREFDKFADSYRDSVNSTLTLSGEDADYFAQGRVAWLRKIFSREPNIHHVMDYGCGIGLGIPHLLTLPHLTLLIGVDVSEKSLAYANANYASDRVRFASFADYKPKGEIDLVVCCNVFHHIPLSERSMAVKYIYDSLRPGGWLAVWEHNPWNPAVVYVMNHSPIDQDAIRVKPHRARRLLRAGGFAVVKTDYLFFFPAFLSLFRSLEPLLSGVPFGAQYLALGRKI